jgi:5-methylcytosine-specific restriction enzyme A
MSASRIMQPWEFDELDSTNPDERGLSYRPARVLGTSLPQIAAEFVCGRSGRWPACREMHLKIEPKCAACATVKFLEVHHKKPYHLFPELELVEDNLITLCESPAHNCHLIFGHSLLWAAYNPHVEEDAARAMERIRDRLLDRV